MSSNVSDFTLKIQKYTKEIADGRLFTPKDLKLLWTYEPPKYTHLLDDIGSCRLEDIPLESNGVDNILLLAFV